MGVEVTGRLVGQHQRRGERQRAGDGHALLLPAGELARQVVEPIAETDGAQQFPRRLAPRRRHGSLGDHPRHQHVLRRRECRQQMVKLEDEPDAACPQRGQGAFRQRRRLASAEHVRSAARRLEQADQVEQRRLARTRRSDQRGELAAGDRQVDAVQHLDRDVGAGAVGLVDVGQPQQLGRPAAAGAVDARGHERIACAGSSCAARRAGAYAAPSPTTTATSAAPPSRSGVNRRSNSGEPSAFLA